MRNLSLFYALLFTFISNSYTQNPLFKIPLSERIANYNISVELDTSKHELRGTEILYWHNASSDSIFELQFHLYLNAFRNDRTTFMLESGGRHRGYEKNEKIWGWTNIHSMKIIDGVDLTELIEFYQPDDGNKNDKTVIKVPLNKPLKPGENISLRIDFTSKLPNIFARTGYTKDYYLVGQWFPKIGVYEGTKKGKKENGGWNCHQFHANSEFYADFGVYNVELNVPQDYVIGATGLLEYEKNNDNGTKYLLYHAEDVIDFAWTASPDFVVVEEAFKKIKIKLLVQPQHFHLSERFMNSTKSALEYLETNVGKYPYPNITIVDPPIYGRGSGGMEYPTFVTTSAFWGLPQNFRMLEATTIHEIIHNYFQGIVASNEFEEPWLDEGFTQYYETRIMDETYGIGESLLDLFDYKVGSFESTRMGYIRMKNKSISDNSPYAWEFPQRSYGVLTYDKTTTWLKTLENIIGRVTFDEVFKTYYDKWKFKHPSGDDFIDVVNEVVLDKHGLEFGENMNWFFDQVLYGIDVCDYKINYIKNSITRTDNSHTGIEMYNSEVAVYREGSMKLPIEILIHFEDGDEITEFWNGKEKFKIFRYNKPQKVIWAKVDPEFKIALDVNLQNNSFTTKHESIVINKYAAKILFWVENILLSFGILF